MEIILSIVSFIGGLIAQKIFDALFEKITIHNKYSKNKKSITKLSNSLSSSNDINIEMLASGLPYFDRNDILKALIRSYT